MKTYRKGQTYTLTLVQQVGYNTWNKWTAQATYNGSYMSILEFRSGDTVYTIDKQTHLCTITNYDLVYDSTFMEWSNLERYDFCKCIKINKSK